MASFAELSNDVLPKRVIPALAPPQAGQSPEPTAGLSQANPIISGPPDLSRNTPDSIASIIKDAFGFDPKDVTTSKALEEAQKTLGPYPVEPPQRSAYQVQENKVPGWALGLGMLLSGGYGGSFMQGYQQSQGLERQHQLDMLKAQQDYDTALRNYQAGRAGWTKEIVQAARDNVNTKRQMISSVLPWLAPRQDTIVRSQVEAYRAGLQYLTSQANLEYRYFAESKNLELKQAQIQIQQTNAQIRQAYNDARIATEQGNQILAQRKLALLKLSTESKIKQEELATKLLQSKIAQVDVQDSQKGFDAVSKEIETTINEINQLVGSSSPANQYLMDGLNVHLQQLIKQRDIYNTRLKQLQKTPAPTTQPPSSKGPSKYTPANIMQAINNMNHAGLTRDQIHQRLQESGIDPADWGF